MAELHGIDISNHNGNANFDTLKRSGVSFCIMKAGEGGNFKDRYFPAHWSSSKAHGVVRGAYYYGHPNRDPLQQAQHFVDIINDAGGLAPGDLPPSLDFEETKGVADRKALASWALRFLQHVENLTGLVPMLYTYPDFWKNAVGNPQGFSKYPLWYASYSSRKPVAPASWAGQEFIWQHSVANPGPPGVGWPTDLNVAPDWHIQNLSNFPNVPEEEEEVTEAQIIEIVWKTVDGLKKQDLKDTQFLNSIIAGLQPYIEAGVRKVLAEQDQ